MQIGPISLKRKRWEPFAFASPSLALIALVILYVFFLDYYVSGLTAGAVK